MATKRFTALKWTGIVLGLFILAHVALNLLAAARLRRAYAALEKDGRPMTAEQIIPQYVPDTNNAALLYNSAIFQLKAEAAGDKNVFDYVGGIFPDLKAGRLTPDKKEELRLVLRRESVVNALRLVAQGIEKSACRFDLDYTQGPVILLPHLAELRGLSRLLAANAMVQAEDGEAERAWNTAITNLRFADALRTEPILISQLLRVAQIGLAMDCIQTIAKTSPPSETQAAAADALLLRLDNNAPFILGMDGERLLLGEWCFRRPWDLLGGPCLALSDSPSPSAMRTFSAVFGPLWRADHAAYLHILNEYARAPETPYWRIGNDAGEAMISTVPKYCILTRMLTPALDAVRTKQAGMQAQLRVIRVGIALMRHRRAHGSYPTELAAVDPAFLKAAPEDPFTGKPLIYRAEGAGFALYSVAENLKDDGGTPRPEAGKAPDEVMRAKAWDIVWKVTPDVR